MLHGRAVESKQRQGSRSEPRTSSVTRAASSRQLSTARLQSAFGNQALLRWISGSKNGGATLQRKCACGGGSGGQCAECAEKEKESVLQRKATVPVPVSGVPSIVHDVLRSPGSPLDSGTRETMEPRFGYDFSPVRVHTDSRAAESARAVNAVAYTVGRNVVFDTGTYAPQTSSGQKLLAHELAHVVQQSGSTALTPQALRVSSRSDPSEKEADRAADSVAASAPAVVGKNGVALQRYSHVDCTEDFLRAHVWPSDYIARQMLAKAIRVLGASPSDPAVTALLRDYFKNPTPNVATILGVFNKVNQAFTANDYTYECENDCDASDGDAYTRPYMPWGRIHLCENLLGSRSNNYIAEVILHEFTHKYARTGDTLYCNAGCPAGDECCPCGAGLSASDALDNADSYACFADRLYGVAI